MKNLFTRAQYNHAAMSLGAGVAVFLGQVAYITTNPWAEGAALAGIATLASLGVGIARRAPARPV